jgi:uncharacterized protein YaaR (DUF327 family)
MKVIDRRADFTSMTGAITTGGAAIDEFGHKMEQKRMEGGYKDKLKNLLERIDTQAQRLSERLDIAELKRYRSLVTEFIDLSVRHSVEYQKEHTLDGKGRHRIFGIVKKIDVELENLTRELLKEHKDYISVLAKLDDIRGLLVDIIT